MAEIRAGRRLMTVRCQKCTKMYRIFHSFILFHSFCLQNDTNIYLKLIDKDRRGKRKQNEWNIDIEYRYIFVHFWQRTVISLRPARIFTYQNEIQHKELTDSIVFHPNKMKYSPNLRDLFLHCTRTMAACLFFLFWTSHYFDGILDV